PVRPMTSCTSWTEIMAPAISEVLLPCARHAALSRRKCLLFAALLGRAPRRTVRAGAAARGTSVAQSGPHARQHAQPDPHSPPAARHDAGGVRAPDRGHRLDREPVGALARRAVEARLEGDPRR